MKKQAIYLRKNGRTIEMKFPALNVERFRSSPPVGSFDALIRDRDGRPVLLDYKTKEGA